MPNNEFVPFELKVSEVFAPVGKANAPKAFLTGWSGVACFVGSHVFKFSMLFANEFRFPKEKLDEVGFASWFEVDNERD